MPYQFSGTRKLQILPAHGTGRMSPGCPDRSGGPTSPMFLQPGEPGGEWQPRACRQMALCPPLVTQLGL